MIVFDKEKENFLDSQYRLIEELGEAKSSKIFLVEDTDNKKKYICKNYEKNHLFEKEYNNYMKYINKSQSDALIRYIYSNGINKDNVLKYIIFEYAENDSLFNYLQHFGGFDEIYCKVIFEQILNGIKHLHDIGLCYNNINLENILLGKNFKIKLSNFSHSDIIEKCKRHYSVDRYYLSPEVLSNENTFNGIKSDIFSLGIILLELATGKKMSKWNKCYKDYVKTTHYRLFWERVIVNSSTNLPLSDNFKSLIQNMILFKPEKRLTIEEILNSDWMSEINDMDEERKEMLDLKLLEEFSNRKKKINEMRNLPQPIIDTICTKDYNPNVRRGLEDDNNIFPSSVKIKETKSIFQLNYVLRLNLATDPYELMNNLYQKLEDEFSEDIEQSEDKEFLKFTVEIRKKHEIDDELTKKMNSLLLEEKKEATEQKDVINEEEKKETTEQKDEINEEQEEEDDDGDICIIEIELFKYKNECYLLRFVRKSHDIDQYLENIKLIESMIKK